MTLEADRVQEPCKLTSGGPRFQALVQRYDVAKGHQTRMLTLENPKASKVPGGIVIEES
jgi:hypothetical protein